MYTPNNGIELLGLHKSVEAAASRRLCGAVSFGLVRYVLEIHP
jgi:hypothetical protein